MKKSYTIVYRGEFQCHIEEAENEEEAIKKKATEEGSWTMIMEGHKDFYEVEEVK